MMKIYTEEDLRLAFRAGESRGEHNGYYDQPLSESEYIESLTEKIEENTVPFTYFSLRQKLNWEDFCDLTGVTKNTGFEIKDSEIFYLTESKTKKYNLL